MKNLLKQVTLDRCNRKKDKSVSMTFITQLEQSPEELMEIDKLLSDSGVLYFKSNGNLTAQEIKELDGAEIEVEGKSKSQRLRNVIFIEWKQKKDGLLELRENEVIDDFNSYYSHEMEIIMEHKKSKLI